MTLFSSLELFDENHADVFRRCLPDSFCFLVGGIVVESERRLLRWETDDRIHRARRPLHENGRRIRGQHHAPVFRQQPQHDWRVLLKFVRVDDVVSSDVEDGHQNSP